MSHGEIWGILVAGGVGSRFHPSQNKLLALLDGKPVIWHSTKALIDTPSISGLVIVSHPHWQTDYQTCLAPLLEAIPHCWALGGETRRESVYNGLLALPISTQFVAIHDAARPWANPNHIEKAIQVVASGQAQASSLGYPVINTIKRVKAKETPQVIETLDRETLWEVNTPQVFSKEILLKAHQTVPKEHSAFDDLQLLEHLTPMPKIDLVEDSPENKKITLLTDIE